MAARTRSRATRFFENTSNVVCQCVAVILISDCFFSISYAAEVQCDVREECAKTNATVDLVSERCGDVHLKQVFEKLRQDAKQSCQMEIFVYVLFFFLG